MIDDQTSPDGNPMHTHTNVFDQNAVEHNEHRVVRTHTRRGDKLVRARDLDDLERAVKYASVDGDFDNNVAACVRRLIDHARNP